MLFDHIIPKPPNVGAYDSHRLLEGLTSGGRALYVDMGDHLIVRSDVQIAPDLRPVPKVSLGDIRAFELRASCGVKVKGQHRYYPLKDWRARHDWLRRRSADYGFEVLTINVTARRIKIQKTDRQFWIDSSDFTGILKVTDEDALQNVLRMGFPGPARAFGHGLLII